MKDFLHHPPPMFPMLHGPDTRPLDERNTSDRNFALTITLVTGLVAWCVAEQMKKSETTLPQPTQQQAN
jgi:hypothetical protein